MIWAGCGLRWSGGGGVGGGGGDVGGGGGQPGRAAWSIPLKGGVFYCVGNLYLTPIFP